MHEVKIRGRGKTVRVVFKISLQSLLYKKGGGEQSSAHLPADGIFHLKTT